MELLPEVQQLVARYLGLQDRLSCMRVSRAWYDSFLDLACRYVMIQSGYGVKRHVPPKGWIQKYGGFIQELDLISESEGETPLRHLLATPDSQREQVVILLPRLKKLKIGLPCSLREAEEWLSGCPNLESLTLRMVKGVPTMDIITLEAIMAKDKGLHLLRHCPRLTRLEIDNRYYNFGCGLFHVTDLVEIVNHWPPLLTELGLGCNSVPEPWFKALSAGLLERMTVLDLYLCDRVEDWMFKLIVCSCPLLVELGWNRFFVEELFGEEDTINSVAESATTIAATVTMPLTSEKEGIQVRPWACTALRSLHICKLVWSGSLICNRAAMEHFGLLRDLRSFSVQRMRHHTEHHFYSSSPWPKEPCKLSAVDLQTVPDALWMRENWPLLEHFELKGWDY